MFINHDIIAIAFRFINFIAIIGGLFFIFEKYGKSKFLARIEQEKADHQELRTQQIKLETEQAQLDIASKEDALACEKLKSHIDSWKKTVLLSHDTQAQKYVAIMHARKKRKELIADLQEQARVKSIVTQSVIAHLEKSLTRHFADAKKSDTYLTEIIHFMNRKSS